MEYIVQLQSKSFGPGNACDDSTKRELLLPFPLMESGCYIVPMNVTNQDTQTARHDT